MSDIAKKLFALYRNDKFKGIIVMGERGYGMSSYSLKILTEIYNNACCNTENS